MFRDGIEELFHYLRFFDLVAEGGERGDEPAQPERELFNGLAVTELHRIIFPEQCLRLGLVHAFHANRMAFTASHASLVVSLTASVPSISAGQREESLQATCDPPGNQHHHTPQHPTTHAPGA